MARKVKVLIVDDEKDIRDAIELLLNKENFATEKAANGEMAVEMVKQGNHYDLIIMDIIMPKLTGTEAVKKIRETLDCPILFLTAKSADEDKVEAYSSGGDDYLQKPFSSVELLLRINALFKRVKHQDQDDIELDQDHKLVVKKGEKILLTDKEYELLEFLIENKGRLLTTQELYESIWKEQYFRTSANTVMVHILNLRKKIEVNYTEPKHIKTIWGKGYCYED